MKHSTVRKYTEILTAAKNSGQNLHLFCEKNGLNYNSIVGAISTLKKQNDVETDEVKTLLHLYSEVVSKKGKSLKEVIETDDRAETSILRGEDGRINFYSYQIFRRDKAPLTGKLTREEMNTIHRLYSYYGDSLTQRVISRHFVDLSLIDFKRILRAFNITKASAPFAPHMFEELSEDELREIQLREKENSFLRKAEEDQIKNTEKLLKKYAQENIELKRQMKDLSEFKVKLPENLNPILLEERKEVGRNINLYLSDLHLGAALTTGSLYKENIKYGFAEAQRRLVEILERLHQFGTFDTINLVLMGDNIDCAGVYGKTARLDHDLPENMDAREQANKFIELLLWFIGSLVEKENKFCSHINLYSVPCGNHGGNYEYMCNKALIATVNAKFPNIKTTFWEDFFGIFEFNDNTFICCHGKDDQYMKRGLPLNLDDKSKVMLYEWLHEMGIHKDNIHFIKGDLHSNSLNSCKRLDYRNVLSLFGASDYSNYNFSRNSYGMSYDLFVGGNLVRGTFENLQKLNYYGKRKESKKGNKK